MNGECHDELSNCQLLKRMLYGTSFSLELYNSSIVKILKVEERKFDCVWEAYLLKYCLCVIVLLKLFLLFQSWKTLGLFVNIHCVLPWMWDKFVQKMNLWQQQILWTNWSRWELLSFSEITETQPFAGHKNESVSNVFYMLLSIF